MDKIGVELAKTLPSTEPEADGKEPTPKRDANGPIRLPEGDGIIDHYGGDPQSPYPIRCP